MDRGRQLGSVRRPDSGHRCIRAHPSGIRAFVAVERALEVLGGQERYGAPPVADREERHLGTFEELLDDDVAADPAQRAQRLVDLGLRPADEDPLPGREPVGLDDAGRTRDRQPTCGRRLRRRPSPPSRTPSSLRSAPQPRSARRPGTRTVEARRRARARAAAPARRRRARRRASARGRESPRRRPHGSDGIRRASRSPDCQVQRAARSGSVTGRASRRARARDLRSRR